MAALLSTNSLVTSVPRSPSSPSSSFLSRLPIRRLPDDRRRSLAGRPRRISARDRRRGRKGRPDGEEVMASSSHASPPPLWRIEKGGSVSVVGYDEEEALRTTDRNLGGVETSNSGYRSGSSASLNTLSVKEAPGENFHQKYSSTNLFKKTSSRMSAIKCFGVDLSPDNIAVAVVYFVQGVLGLARLAVSFYLKDDLHLDPAEVAAVVKTQAQCLCSFLGSSTATQLGAIVNQAQALSLPGACKIDNPLANQCNAASSTQTPAAQSPQGALAPASQDTPTDASSPSSLPTIPAGSGKAGESSDAEASANFMPFVFFLPLLASSVSMLPAF